MTALTGNTIATTYKDLLQVSNNNGGIDTTMRPVSDGEGTPSALQINNAAVNINGTFQLNGVSLTKSATQINQMAAIGSATGIIAITSGDVYGRTLVAGTPVSITNANGAAGNPTITLASIANVSGSYGPFTKFAVNDFGQIVSATDTEVSVSIATLRTSEVITETVCATSYVNIGGNTSIAGALVVNGIVSANNNFFIAGKLVAATEVSVVNQLNTSNLYAASAIIDNLSAGNLSFNSVSVSSFTANQLTVVSVVSAAVLNVTGTATASTFEPTGDTASGDNAAIGYTAAEGLILTGQGSTNDVTIKNNADAEVMGVLTGTTTAAFTGQVTGTGFTGTLDGVLGGGTPAAATVTTLNGVTAPTAQYTTAEETKLAGIETSADVTDSTNVLASLVGQEAVATGFTGTLDGILGGGTPAAATVTTLNGVTAPTAQYTTAEETKLAGIETAADVTDSTNVLASLVGQEAVATGFTGTLDGVLGGGTPAAATVTVLTASADSAFNSTGALQISKGTTAQRPTAVLGMLRYNSTTSEFEGYSGGTPAWKSVGGSAISNDTTTSSNLFPLSADAVSGTASQVYTSNAKYLYKPSDGSLQAPAMISTNGLVVNSATVATSYTIPSGSNAMSVGTMTVASGATVTVSSGSKWVVI